MNEWKVKDIPIWSDPIRSDPIRSDRIGVDLDICYKIVLILMICIYNLLYVHLTITSCTTLIAINNFILYIIVFNSSFLIFYLSAKFSNSSLFSLYQNLLFQHFHHKASDCPIDIGHEVEFSTVQINICGESMREEGAGRGGGQSRGGREERSKRILGAGGVTHSQNPVLLIICKKSNFFILAEGRGREEGVKGRDERGEWIREQYA